MLFSVIVPIYKIEKYLRRCIDSVLCQTFTDFELILVDDGSPDGCPAICDEYATKDDRIKVIHKENGGLVSARQAGIKIASGDYVFNLDGDDAVKIDALESCAAIINETDADIVSFSYTVFRNGKCENEVHDIPSEGLYNRAEMEKYIFPTLLCDRNMKYNFYFVWGRAVRRSLILPNQLHVSTKISHGEDVSCIIPCFLQAQKVYVSKKSIYFYTVRDDSLSTDVKTSQIPQIASTIESLRSSVAPKPWDFDEQIARYSCFMCFAIMAAAAERGQFESLDEIETYITNSIHKKEIEAASFDSLSPKSRIVVGLMKKGKIKSAFRFLHLCGVLKKIIRKG